MAEPGFWDNPEEARKVTTRVDQLKKLLGRYQELQDSIEDALIMVELGRDEKDRQVREELERDLEELERRIDQLELELLLTGEYDEHDAILTLHPGAGGTESQDWASMLLRMYLRWAEQKSYDTKVLDILEGEEAGIKSATILVKGEDAYGFLRGEKGIHRLVRISPFDASGRRHTSFASVEVMPDIEDNTDEVEIRSEDIRVDTYRASGAGGQHVNKTSSAVRITHKPTDIVVTCQNERSQHSNRATAMKILRAKLLELQEQQREEELAEIRGEQREIAWGNQIRSYVFHPYSMVKDHRTGVEVGDVDSVMDGQLDDFIYGYREHQANEDS
jgi:peptide chain release factor 2